MCVKIHKKYSQISKKKKKYLNCWLLEFVAFVQMCAQIRNKQKNADRAIKINHPICSCPCKQKIKQAMTKTTQYACNYNNDILTAKFYWIGCLKIILQQYQFCK